MLATDFTQTATTLLKKTNFKISATDCFLPLRLMITLELNQMVRNVLHLTLNISKLTTGAIT